MIWLSKLTDYAIVLLTHLAATESNLTAQQLSSRSRIPQPTVSKLCKELAKAGLLVSIRGRRGGYGLARSPDQINVAEIVEALEGPIGFTECSTPGTVCDIEQDCLAKATWDPVTRAIHGALSGMPLSALARFSAAPVLSHPPAGDDSLPIQIGMPTS